MTVLATLNFDDQTEGSAVTVVSPWTLTAGGTTPVATAAAAAHGAMGARWSSTSSAGSIYYELGASQTAKRVLSFYFKPNTFSTANQYVGAIFDVSSNNQADWRINTNRTITLRNASVAIATSTATLTAGTWYRCEWSLDPTTSGQELRIYAGESATPLIDLTGTYTSTTARRLTFGPDVAAAGGAIDYDTVRVADDWVGPLAPSFNAVATQARTVTIDATGSTGSGLTYSIAATSGDTGTPVQIAAGKWVVPAPSTSDAVYTVTVTDGTNTSDIPLTITKTVGGTLNYWDGSVWQTL